MTADREQTRRDAEKVRTALRNAEYFDSEDGSDQYVEAMAAFDALLAELEQAEQALDAAMQYVAPKDRDWIEGLRRGN